MDEKDGVSVNPSPDEGGTAETEASACNVDSESSDLQNHVDMSVEESFSDAMEVKEGNSKWENS